MTYMKVLLSKDDYRECRKLFPGDFPVIANPIKDDEEVEKPWVKMTLEEFSALKKLHQQQADLIVKECHNFSEKEGEIKGKFGDLSKPFNGNEIEELRVIAKKIYVDQEYADYIVNDIQNLQEYQDHMVKSLEKAQKLEALKARLSLTDEEIKLLKV